MEKQTKLCRACNTVKNINEFYKKTTTKDGREYRCRACCNAKKLIPRIKTEKIEKSKNLYGIHDFYSLSGVNESSYKLMYELLNILGFDINNKDKSIHEQFIDRSNKKYNINLKYKTRSKKDLSRYLSDGSENPEYVLYKRKY